MQPFEEINCESAQDLLEHLSPWHSRWTRTGGQSKWLFRGQADANWELNPSAMREKPFKVWSPGNPIRIAAYDLASQLEYESRAVREFLGMCFRSGLPIPDDSQWIRNGELLELAFGKTYFDRISKGVEFPPAVHRSLYALAQHHGVPTRLLDWTELPLTAAYFACCRVAKKVSKSACKAQRKSEPVVEQRGIGRAAVFALRRESVFSHLADEVNPYLARVDAPYATNPNLRAQRGTFTLVVHRTPPEAHQSPSIEELVRRWLAQHPDQAPTDILPMLVKFVIPHAECRRLLRLLAQANVHAGTAFSGYDAAVKALDELGFH